MKISSEDTRTEYLFDTNVENIFINEYMPLAPGNHVKVYLLVKMYMDSGTEITVEELAKTLRLQPEQVEEALLYWAQNGVLRRRDEEIECISLKEKLYGRHPKKKASTITAADSSLLENKRIKRLVKKLSPLLGEKLDGTGIQKMLWWLDDLKASEAVIEEAVIYCVKRGKTSMNYIDKIVRDWTERGITTREQVEHHLEETDQRHYAYKRVMKALGFPRSATERERQIIDTWFDDLSCSMEDVLAACAKTSGISNPNINYVNTVLRKRRGMRDGKEGGGISTGVVRQYYQYLRQKAEEAAKARHQASLAQVPALRRLEEELLAQRKNLTQVMISGGADKRQRAGEIKDAIKRLEKEREQVMVEHGIPAGFDNVVYRCRICGDTGLQQDGARCQCWAERAEEAAVWYQQRRAHTKGDR
ncbi:MAG: DnaD domain protein [Eubacteriales bacterium]|nr:DnaD domain protein [Eubacteriales bacterium]